MIFHIFVQNNKMRDKFIVLLSAYILLSACSNVGKSDYALVSGKIENKNSSLIIVSGNNYRHSIKVSADGTFSDTLKIPKDNFYLFADGKQGGHLYLEKGYNLTLSIDAAKFDQTLTFAGKGSKENNFLAKKTLLQEEIIGEAFDSVYSKDENEFQRTIQQYDSTANDLLASEEGLSPDFIESETNNIHFQTLNFLGGYKDGHMFYTNIDDFTVSEEFLKPLQEEKLNNIALYDKSREYLRFVLNVFSEKILDTINNDRQSVINEIIAIDHGPMRNQLARTLFYSLGNNQDNQESLLNAIIKISKDQELTKNLKEQYRKIVLLTEGKPSPRFSYENYKGGSTSLSDFRGSYLYIDIWATWCQPCLYEIPFLKELEKEFHGKNIRFVSISIDKSDDYHVWKKMVKEKNLSGIQLFADNSFDSKFVKDYEIHGIPRFILIDPQGNIVNANASRPSEKKTKSVLEKLLK